jgi:hypothetical protein
LFNGNKFGGIFAKCAFNAKYGCVNAGNRDDVSNGGRLHKVLRASNYGSACSSSYLSSDLLRFVSDVAHFHDQVNSGGNPVALQKIRDAVLADVGGLLKNYVRITVGGATASAGEARNADPAIVQFKIDQAKFANALPLVPSVYVGTCGHATGMKNGVASDAIRMAYATPSGSAPTSDNLYGFVTSALSCLDDQSAAANSVDAAYPTGAVEAAFGRDADGDLISSATGAKIRDIADELSKTSNNCAGLGISNDADCTTFCADCLRDGDIDKCLDGLESASSAHFSSGNPEGLIKLANKLGLGSNQTGVAGSGLHSGEDVTVQSLGDWLVSLEGKWSPAQIARVRNTNSIMAYVSKMIGFLNSNPAILNKPHKQNIVLGNVARALNLQPSIRGRDRTASLSGIAEHLSMLPNNNISVASTNLGHPGLIVSGLSGIGAQRGGSLISAYKEKASDRIENIYNALVGKLKSAKKSLSPTSEGKIKSLIQSMKQNETTVLTQLGTISEYVDLLEMQEDLGLGSELQLETLKKMVDDHNRRSSKLKKRYVTLASILSTLQEVCDKMEGKSGNPLVYRN